MRNPFFLLLIVTSFLIIAPCGAAAEDKDILGPSFPVTDDGIVDNMEAVYNGRNIALFYNWSPYVQIQGIPRPGADPLYFQLCDANLRPIGKPKLLIDRCAHQIKAIWDGEKYVVAATVWHKTNNFFHHKSLLLMILDKNGNVLKQREIELGRSGRYQAFVPSLLLLTGQNERHFLVYRNDLMNVGYRVDRYEKGTTSYLMTINSSGNIIRTKFQIININEIDYDYITTLNENGFAAAGIPHWRWENKNGNTVSLIRFDFNGDYKDSINIILKEEINLVYTFEYLNGNFYFQVFRRTFGGGTEAYIVTIDKTFKNGILLKETDAGIIDDSYATFVSGDFIYSCYVGVSGSYGGDPYRRHFVVKRHGLDGRFVNKLQPTENSFLAPHPMWDLVWEPPAVNELYRNPTIVSVGTHSYFIYVAERSTTHDGNRYTNYEYRARKMSNDPFTESRVVYIRVGTEDVLPKTRLVMWNVANVPNVRITMPDGTKRIYAPTGHMQVKHFGKQKQLILRATGPNGEKIKRTIWVKP